jgi:hypothetical protein
LAFSPDFVWIKPRSAATQHNLYDVVRGATKELYSDYTSAEGTAVQGLTSFNSDGFSLGSLSVVNGSSTTFVGWAWDAGTSTVSNTAGSITSQVRANATAGFSVVTFNIGSAGTYTVGHGLGVAPEFIITKSRGSAFAWRIYHKTLGTSQFIQFDTGAAAASTNIWSSTAPSSTVFGIVSGQTQPANDNIVAYCFAPVVGYSSFGSYTGNGSSDGPFVYTGFRVKWYLVKQSSASGENWRIIDATRSPYNVAQDRLLPNSSAAEAVQPNEVDFLSNGFKFRSADSAYNGSGSTYIYAAFAEMPFNYSRAR